MEGPSKHLNKSELDASKSFLDDSNVAEGSEVSIIKEDEANVRNKESHDDVIPNLNVVPKFIIRVNEPQRVKWDLFVMGLATWNCLWIPLDIAFEPAISNSIPMVILDNLIDFFFIIDIFITFRTTYIKSSTGDEVMDPSKIAWHYLKTRFAIDLLSTFPFRYLIDGNKKLEFLNLFGILKVARVLRLGRIINVLNAKEEIKMTLKLCNLVFGLLIYIHLAGCTWYYIHKGK